jgi:hypothetical protein
MSYINRNRARQTGTNRTTQAEISNLLRLSFPGRVNYGRTLTACGLIAGEQLTCMRTQCPRHNQCPRSLH